MRFLLSLQVFLLLLPGLAGAQDFDRYTPVQAENPVPDDFLKGSVEKFEEHLENLEGKKGWDRRIREKFLLANNFEINMLLSSGKVLFNDRISKYLSAVLDKVLESDPALRSKLRIYTVRSTEVNAFATGDGIILVTMGLLAQLETEAQLAFILSHEVVHYVQQHSMNSYVEAESISRGRELYQGLSNRDRVLARHFYSRELEMESDREGLDKFYNKSGYTFEAINEVFEILQYSYLPFDEEPFYFSFLETEHMKIPDLYIPEKIKEISVKEDWDDSFSSHPNISKRKEYTSRLLYNADNSDRAEFLVSKDEFLSIRKMSRFELVRIHQLEHEYPQVLYLASLLIKEEPDSYFLKRYVAAALYALSKLKSAEMSTYDILDDGSTQGQSQASYYLLKKLNAEQLSIMALSHTWRLHKKYPDEAYFRLMSDDLMQELVFTHKVKFTDFYTKDRASIMADYGYAEDSIEVVDSRGKSGSSVSIFDGGSNENDYDYTDVEVKVKGEQGEEGDDRSKIEKIKSRKALARLANPKSFVWFAFVDEMKDKTFTDRLNYWLDEYSRKEEAELNKSYEQKRREAREKARLEKLREKKGVKLGVDTLLVMEPMYVRFDADKEQTVKHLSTETVRLSLEQAIYDFAMDENLSVNFFKMRDLRGIDAGKFNEAALMKEWFMERMGFEELRYITSQYDRISEITSKYKSHHLMVPAVMSRKHAKDFNEALTTCLCYSATLVMLPAGIYELFKENHTTDYYYMVFNLNDGELAIPGYKRVHRRDEQSMVKRLFHSAISQVKSKED